MINEKKYPRIIYMGTPKLSAKILEGLIENGYNIVALIAQEDKPVGRKKEILPVPTKEVAIKYNIPVFQPKKIRLDYEFVKQIKPDLIVTCAYGQIVPQGLLDIPTLGCLNVHGSVLPKYRGASPIQTALWNGDKTTGVTLMQMIDKMDAGLMYSKKEFPLEKFDNYTTTCDKISGAGLSLLLESLPKYIEGKLKGIPQDESMVTFCSKITKEQEHLNINESAENLVHIVNALSETPGGYFLLNGQVLKVYKAEVANDKNTAKIGEIVSADKHGFIVQTGSGQLSLLSIQRQGKKKMDYKSFINGEKNLCTQVLN